jgi:hypothetical protein
MALRVLGTENSQWQRISNEFFPCTLYSIQITYSPSLNTHERGQETVRQSELKKEEAEKK